VTLLRVRTNEPDESYRDKTFLFLPFLSAPFSLGHDKERGGVESQASVCFVGGNPVLLRAEPTKQKTRRPEWRGIIRAVSPKKMRKRGKKKREEKEGCPILRTSDKRP
jgi:hypothetical protein